MPASKQDVARTVRKYVRRIEEIASTIPESAWSAGVYENGWNARELLCHLAAGGAFAGVMVNIARAPGTDPGSSVDEDAWNAAEIAARQGKSVAELLDELRSNSERSIATVEATPDDVLSAHYSSRWGIEGPLADVLIESIEDHLENHLAELRAAVG